MCSQARRMREIQPIAPEHTQGVYVQDAPASGCISMPVSWAKCAAPSRHPQPNAAMTGSVMAGFFCAARAREGEEQVETAFLPQSSHRAASQGRSRGVRSRPEQEGERQVCAAISRLAMAPVAGNVSPLGQRETVPAPAARPPGSWARRAKGRVEVKPPGFRDWGALQRLPRIGQSQQKAARSRIIRPVNR